MKVVAVMGVDGTGKSAVVASVAERLRAEGLRVATRHHAYPVFSRVHRLMGSGGGASGAGGGASPPRGARLLAARVLACVDGLAARPSVRRSARGADVLISDRWFGDHLANYFADAPRAARAYLGLVPRADLHVLLDAPAEVVHARKPDGPLVQRRRLAQAYRAAADAGWLAPLAIVDATRPPAEVADDVTVRVLEVMRR